MTDKELMQQALEALKFGLHVGFDESSESQIKKGGKAFDQHGRAITALREALAQPAKPLTDAQIEPLFLKRQKQKEEGEKDAWYFYAWGVNDGEAAHGITGEQK